jgi:hypothetical protein
MKLILPFDPPLLPETISYRHRIMCMGSCFAEEIGSLMMHHRYSININPFGILFNSISIAKAIQYGIQDKTISADDLVEDHGLWHSLLHHGSFSGKDKELVLSRINGSVKSLHAELKNIDWLIITLGSSWVYRYKRTGDIVANCHKIPASEFSKELLDTNVQVKTLKETFSSLRNINPGLRILLTVSPVRYVRDGLVENNLSKAQLISTVHSLAKELSSCYYFPAFELVTDVLRDYRFFKEDMVHPNSQAISFIWEYFKTSCLEKNERKIFEAAEALLNLEKHRILNDDLKAEHELRITHALERFQSELNLLYD